jgi:signal peptide peptidase SppA
LLRFGPDGNIRKSNKDADNHQEEVDLHWPFASAAGDRRYPFKQEAFHTLKKPLLERRRKPAYLRSMTETSHGTTIRELSGRAFGGLRGLVPQRFRRDRPIVPVVRLTGIVGFSTPLRPGLTLAGLARTLDRAFALRQAAAVALVVNSPGGSPVQSHLIFRRIRQLAEQHRRRVIAFIEDAGASGGYMIACAADEIVADQHSIVGSIGVVGGSFGFDKAIAKLGIERRLYTSGEHKAMLDPFLPENADEVERLKKLQREIHDDFIALVQSRRAGKLAAEDDLFSGAYWTGRRALELGLVDAIGDLRSVLRERFGDKLVTPLVSAERGWLGRRLLGTAGDAALARPAGLAVAEDLISALEARAIWARYGL